MARTRPRPSATKAAIFRIEVSSRLLPDRAEYTLGFGRRRIDYQRAFQLGTGGRGVLELQVRFAQCDPCRGGVRAPDRDLQGIDGLLGTPGAKQNPADEQVCLGLVRGQVDRPPQLDERLSILLPLIQPSAAIEMEGGQFALLPLGGVDDGLLGAGLGRGFRLGPDTFESTRDWQPVGRCPLFELFVARG